MDRVHIGWLQPARGLLHGTAALASVAGLVLLVLRAVTLAPLVSTPLRTDTASALMTVLGGAVCLVGVFLFVNDRPKLFPKIFSHHELFHVMVVSASVLHFIAIRRVVATLKRNCPNLSVPCTG